MFDWLTARKEALPGDWAARPLYRLFDDVAGQSAIMIHTHPDNDPQAIEGHTVGPVAKLYRALKERGVDVPAVYDARPDEGILVMEDFGDYNWRRHLDNDGDENVFYPQAMAALAQFKGIVPTPEIDIPNFRDSYIFKRTIWYLTYYRSIQDEGAQCEFLDIWDALVSKLERDEPVHFVHGDFHPGNLMKKADGTLGVLDVGGAFWGSGIYDLVNLLEDIRHEVPGDVRQKLKEQYHANGDVYAILHAQFYMRLLGQMTKREFAIPDRIPQALTTLVEQYDVLKPLKPLVTLGK